MRKPKVRFLRLKAFGAVTTKPLTLVKAIEKVCRKYSLKKQYRFRYDVN